MDPARDDDAQRSLEQHALRNVRSLYEKLARADQMDAHGERFIVWGVGIVVVLVVSGVAASVIFKPDNRAAEELRRCEIDAAVQVMTDKRKELKQADPSLSQQQLEQLVTVTDKDVKAKAAQHCRQSPPAR